MEKEKQLDRLKNSFKNIKFNNDYLLSILYFLILLISDLFSKNLFLLMVLIAMVHLSWSLNRIINTEKNYTKIIIQLYLVFSGYSLIYISHNLINSKSIYLWILFLVSSIKISEYFLNKIFLGEHSKKFYLIKFSIISIVSIIVGIISSLFMKQKVIAFILVNFIIYILTYLNYIFPEKYQKNIFLKYYNTIAFPIIFIYISLILGFIVIK